MPPTSTNAQGRRTSKTTGSTTTKYYYEGESTTVLYETDGSGNLLVRYIYGQNDQLASMVRGGNTYFYHHNAHGDIIALTDSSGTVVAEYDYDAWGNPVSTGLEGTVVNPYRYAGYRYDSETGMYYLSARYYAPEIGRFITRDSFHGFEDEPASLNQYAYAHGNPVMYVDPSGHFVWNIVGTVVGAGLGALLGIAIANHYGLTGWIRTAAIASIAVGGAAIGWFAPWVVAKYASGLMTAQSAASVLAVKASYTFSYHALGQMTERGINKKMVGIAIKYGQRFWDPKNNTVNYLLKNGFASGKDLLVAVNPLTKNVVTVIRGTKLIVTRHIPLK